MCCGQRCSNTSVAAFHSFRLPVSFFDSSLTLYLFISINPPPPLSSDPFLLSEEEERAYLTPPVWASHLSLFLPVDHHPAPRLVVEGEICANRAPSLHAWRAVHTTTVNVKYFLLFTWCKSHRKAALSTNIRRTAKHATVFTTLLSPAVFLSAPQPFCSFLFFSDTSRQSCFFLKETFLKTRQNWDCN